MIYNYYYFRYKYCMETNLQLSLVGLAAFVTSVWAVVKYYLQAKNNTPIYKAVKHSPLIEAAIKETKANLGLSHFSINLAEVTNGGGIPRPFSQLFMRVLTSSNDEILKQWGAKFPVDKNYLKFYSDCMEDGYSYFEPTDIGDENYREYQLANGIKSSCMVYLKHRAGICMQFLIIDSHLTKAELLHHYETKAAIRALVAKVQKLL